MAATQDYRVLRPLRHAAKDYQAGSTLALTEKQARYLLLSARIEVAAKTKTDKKKEA